MAQLGKLIIENNKLKRQLSQYQQILGKSPFIDDSVLKGGYRVVKNIEERDNIDCCHRKLGMKVLVIGEDLSFKEYVLKTNDCKKNIWEEVNLTVEENEVFLIEDYSELSENLTTQKELNLILKQLIIDLQTQIDNIELIDEKVQITEATNFAQIGQTQKDFNKNVSNYKTNSDSKNQEQDNRLTNIEGENVAQYDLINDLNSELDSERARNDAQDSRLENLEGINYTWSPTNRTLTLYDNNGTQLSQVSLVSLDNEGTDIRYNASTLSLELYNADNELLDSIPVSSFIGSVGTQLQLNSNQLQLKDSQGNILSTVSFSIVNIQGLQTALDSRLNKGSYPGNASDLKNEIDGKLNKPTTTSTTTSYPFVVGEDGSGNSARLPAGDLGKNFFNSDLSNTTARNHTMNASVTVNTLGNPHSLTGLPNKNTDITNFRKVRVQNASGLDAVVDSKNLLTDGVTSMTDAEKDAWRLAQRKTNETYSTDSPQVDAILPPVINGNETFNQFVTVVGLNLFVNNSSPSIAILEIRRVKDINGIILSTPDIFTGLNIEVSQNNPTILTTSINFSNMPKGYYKAFVTHNGLTNLTSPEFFVGDVISTVALPSPFWIEQTNGSPTILNTQISSTSTSPTTYKSDVLTNASLLQNGFIAEYVCEFSGSVSGTGNSGSGTFGIIGDDNTIYGITIYARGGDGARNSVFLPDGSVMNTVGKIGLTNKMYIIYKNDIVTVINQSTGKVKSFIDPSFKTTAKKAYYRLSAASGNYSNSGSMTFNNIKSF